MAINDKDWAKQAAKKYAKGKFTASQTGARQRAENRGVDASSMQSFEDMIAGKKPRPTRTKK